MVLAAYPIEEIWLEAIVDFNDLELGNLVLDEIHIAVLVALRPEPFWSAVGNSLIDHGIALTRQGDIMASLFGHSLM